MGSLLHVNPVELTWVMLNTVTLVFTLTALFDARADRAAVRLLNGRARELAASGIVRRELIRVMVQVMLLAVALPGLFTPDRNKALTVMVTAEALVLKTDALDRIEGKLDRNTEVSAEAVIEARRAYQEANHLNEKLAAQDQQIADISEDAAATGNRIEGTVNSTAKQVDDLHEGTAPKVVS
jgi:hypothetical protein